MPKILPRTPGFFCPDGAAWGKKWWPCLETKGRRGGEAEWRSGRVERRREGEKCERFRIYYREVPLRAFCGGVL